MSPVAPSFDYYFCALGSQLPSSIQYFAPDLLVCLYKTVMAPLYGAVVKNPPAKAGDKSDMGLILGWEDPLEEEITTHSSNLAWRIPWTEEPGGLQPVGLHRVGHNSAHAPFV